MRALARLLGAHPSTILRKIRRVELARDNPLIDLAADHPPAPDDVAAANDLRARFGKLRGVALVVDLAADRAIVVQGDDVLWSGRRGPILALAVARHLVQPQRLGGLLKTGFKGSPKRSPAKSNLVASVTAAASPDKSIAQVAREVRVHRHRIARLMAKHGLPSRLPGDPVYRGIETAIDGMSDADAKNYLLEAYRQLTGVSAKREIDALERYGVSFRVAKIATALEAAKGQLVPVERLEALMRHAGLSDSEKSITVAICALRKAITARGMPVEIVTVYGCGYALRPAPDTCVEGPFKDG